MPTDAENTVQKRANKARNAKLTPEQRSASAAKAATARWSKRRWRVTVERIETLVIRVRASTLADAVRKAEEEGSYGRKVFQELPPKRRVVEIEEE